MKRSKLLFVRNNKVLMVAGLAGILLSLAVAGIVSALEYTSNPVPVSFTFNSVLSITTDGDIAISNLVPGNKAISANDYSVTVSTNNAAGYVLSASVGCATSDSVCFDSKILGDRNNNSFAMVESTTALTSGKWGVSLDSSATVNSNFQTLALYPATTTINQTTDATGTAATGYQGTQETIFRVGAYAADTQVAGTYTNVINFVAVANIATNCGNYNAEYCMQDVGTWGSNLTPNQQIQAMDARDGKLYYVAKLADGNIWMTQNLDHDIVATTDFYTYANTDIGHGSTPNTSAKWTAKRAIHPTGYIQLDADDYYWYSPQSYDPGDLCWNGTIDLDGTITTDTVACGNDKHYHIGNYYNWTAAVAMNDSSSYTTDEEDVDQSICPAGWRLPTYSGNKSYDNLVTALSLTSGSSGNIQNTPVYFVYGGNWEYYYGQTNAFASYGVYWSSVVNDDLNAYGIIFDADGGLYPQDTYSRDGGLSVRCVAR